LILKSNNKDSLMEEKDPKQAITGSVSAALRLGCAAIGYTIYPGSASRLDMYNELAILAEEAKAAGLVVVVWSYPRGGALTKDGETAIDVSAYAAHIAAQLGAHVIKVKLPSAHLEGKQAKDVYEKNKVAIATLGERVRHVVQSSFAGRRVVIFSGGPATADAAVLDEIRAIRGRAAASARSSAATRSSASAPDALKLMGEIMDIYAR
jgi:class I fructose-bisphosphate aldolase